MKSMMISYFDQDRSWRQIEFQRKILRPLAAAVPAWLEGKATAARGGRLRKMDDTEVNDRFWWNPAKEFFPDFQVASLARQLL